MPSQRTHSNTNHNGDASQPLTAANLTAHDTRMSTAPDGPTPMQRWYTNSEDRIVQGRVAHHWEENTDREALAAEIERIVQEVSERNGGRW